MTSCIGSHSRKSSMTVSACGIRLALFAFIVMCGFISVLPAAGAEVSPRTRSEAIVFDPPIGSGKLLLSEDFEATAVGEIPAGFTKTGAVAVVDDVSHGGKKSLRMEAAPRGPRRITLRGDVLSTLGGEHWGRLYFKVK